MHLHFPLTMLACWIAGWHGVIVAVVVDMAADDGGGSPGVRNKR